MKKNRFFILGGAAAALALTFGIVFIDCDGDKVNGGNSGGNNSRTVSSEEDPPPINTSKQGNIDINYDFTQSVLVGNLAAYLAGRESNSPETPRTVVLASSTVIDNDAIDPLGVWTRVNSAVQNAGKYVVLDLSRCSFAGNTVKGVIDDRVDPSINQMNIIRDNSYIKGITLPNTITSIGENAFYGCDGLTSVNIPNSVQSIGNNAFYGCDGLTSVNIPSSVQSIGKYAFYSCGGLTSVNIQELNNAWDRDAYLTIDEYAFSGCYNLTSVNLSSHVLSIRDLAFYGCDMLTSVTFGPYSELPTFFVSAFPPRYGYYDGVNHDDSGALSNVYHNAWLIGAEARAAGSPPAGTYYTAGGTYTREPDGFVWTKVQ